MFSRRWLYYAATLFAFFLLVACTAAPVDQFNGPSTLDPNGTAASHIASLWWVMLALGTAVFVIVLGLLMIALFRSWLASSEVVRESGNGDTGREWVIRGGIIFPLIVLAIVFGYTIYTLAAVENPQDEAGLKIKVTAQRWWWEIEYPVENVTTANEIHIPVGVPVQFELRSQDVIHSFWVPQLHGKMDVIPLLTNKITLQADRAGIYRGECAEFCGLQHATMGFMVVAQSKEEFAQWLDAQQQSAATPTDPMAKQGQQVFISAGCVYCHAVQGLDAQSLVATKPDLGPDLTHLDSRLMIAGATLANNAGNLAGWVMDAQHFKQGSDMPTMSLTPNDLRALLAYLQTLH